MFRFERFRDGSSNLRFRDIGYRALFNLDFGCLGLMPYNRKPHNPHQKPTHCLGLTLEAFQLYLHRRGRISLGLFRPGFEIVGFTVIYVLGFRVIDGFRIGLQAARLSAGIVWLADNNEPEGMQPPAIQNPEPKTLKRIQKPFSLTVRWELGPSTERLWVWASRA